MLFFKEDYTGAKAKWTTIYNAKGKLVPYQQLRTIITDELSLAVLDPPTETLRLNSFMESAKFLTLTREILENLATKRGHHFSIN